jgi:hypothetical protein
MVMLKRRTLKEASEQSNRLEIIGVLYLIAAIVSTGVAPNWLTIVLYVFWIENILESILPTIAYLKNGITEEKK